MPSALASAHIEGERRLRELTVRALGSVWNGLPGYDRANLDQWLSEVLPIVEAGQRQSVNLTNAYLARSLERQPLPLDTAQLLGAAVRNGAAPAEVYERPFVTLWSGLSNGLNYEDAVSKALARASGMASWDVQASMRATANAVQAQSQGIYGFRRVADPTACEFCTEVDGAYVKRANAMPLHNHCIAGDSAVWMPAGVRSKAGDLGRAHAATRRWYKGEIIILKTAAGHELTVTPNHPVLTDRGWVSAGLLREGDSVVSSDRFDGVGRCVPDKQDMPARIEDRFRAGAMSALALVPLTAEQLHGDGADSEVDVVPLHGGLDADDLFAILQPPKEPKLACRAVCSACFSRLRRLRKPGFWLRYALRGAIRGPNSVAALSLSFAGGPDPVLLTGSPQVYATPQEMALNRVPSNPKPLRQGQDGLPAEIQLDSIREARRVSWSGHVFNLVTNVGWYMANAIVTHNCGCGLEALTEPHQLTAQLPPGVAVHQHGEMGATLTPAGDHFTTESELH